jgi:glycosyltransferase involved in cell wall biosynthesis
VRVVHGVGWYFPDSLGGTEVYVAAVARELARAGLNVAIAAPSASATESSSYTHENVPVFRYPIPPLPTRREARGEDAARGTEAFHEWLRVERPDVVHFHTFVTGLDLLEVEQARAAGARVFVTSHSSALGYVCLRGTLARWGTEPCDGVIRPRRCAACALEHRGIARPVAWAAAALPSALARVADRFEHPIGTALGLPSYIERRAERQRRLFDQIDRFFALTTAARDILIANGAPPQKVAVNRLGIDTDSLKPRSSMRRSSSPITIGYLGRFDPIKGISDLVRAVASLDRAVPVRLDIRGAGATDEAVAVRRACEAAASGDSRISVGGAVPRDQVADVLAGWDVLCCPGLSLEGGPTVAMEAFAVGTPVIGTRFGGLAELVDEGQNGALVAPGDWRALAEVIRALAEQPSTIDDWRRKLPAVRTMQNVTAEYLSAYRA